MTQALSQLPTQQRRARQAIAEEKIRLTNQANPLPPRIQP
jgi:hypothetical protein